MYVDPPQCVRPLQESVSLRKCVCTSNTPWYILETDFKVSLLLSQDSAFTMVGKDLWLSV